MSEQKYATNAEVDAARVLLKLNEMNAFLDKLLKKNEEKLPDTPPVG